MATTVSTTFTTPDALAHLHYHFVFAVKYRRALLSPQVPEHLLQTSRAIEERYEIRIECLGADRDHIHLLCSAHPKLGPGQIARIYKSITARELFKALPAIKKELWGGQFWSDGYYIGTAASHGSWAGLVTYIKNQGQEPQEVDLQLLFPKP